MKKAGILAVACLVVVTLAGSTFGERPLPMRGEHGGERRKGGRGHREGMIARIVSNPKVAQQIGLSEEQIEALKDGTHDIKTERIKLREKLELAAQEQARLMTESSIDEDAVMAAVEKTGEIKTKLAKLQVKQLLLVKKTLTVEQIGQVKELMMQRTKKYRERKKEHSRKQKKEGQGGD